MQRDKERNVRQWWVCGLLALLILGCGGKEKVGREPTVTKDNSVYSDSSNQDMEVVDVERQPTDFPSEGSSVDSEFLDVAAEGADQLPDWSPVYFEFDQAQLTPETREKLLDYGQQLKANSQWRILIEGHCDSRGTEEYNQALGERRAESVRRFLLQFGVRENQMNSISYGELKPAIFREDEEAWAFNRRAEFRIQK